MGIPPYKGLPREFLSIIFFYLNTNIQPALTF